MAKKQTRRTFSVSRATYDIAMAAAARDGIAGSEWVTRLIRAACPELPPQIHASPAPPVVLHVPSVPPRVVPSVVNRVAAINQTCAICGDRPADRREPLEPGRPLFAVCPDCATAPAKAVRP